MKKRILLADDDQEFCEEMCEILETEGYEVRHVHEGSQVPEILHASPCDIVILDYKMPGLNGMEVMEKLNETAPHCKIFLISGKPFLEHILENKVIGKRVAAWLAKPFNVEAFLDKIKNF